MPFLTGAADRPQLWRYNLTPSNSLIGVFAGSYAGINRSNTLIDRVPGIQMDETLKKRYVAEATRLYGVLDRRLAGRDFVADEYSIADISIWPWVSRYEWHNVDIEAFPNVKRWYLAIAARPAVQRGYQVPKPAGDIPMPA